VNLAEKLFHIRAIQLSIYDFWYRVCDRDPIIWPGTFSIICELNYYPIFTFFSCQIYKIILMVSRNVQLSGFFIYLDLFTFYWVLIEIFQRTVAYKETLWRQWKLLGCKTKMYILWEEQNSNHRWKLQWRHFGIWGGIGSILKL